MTIGEKIRILSEIRKINKEAMAQELNISLEELAAWENDEVLPSLEQALFLARKFKVQMEILVDQKMKIIPKSEEEKKIEDQKIVDNTKQIKKIKKWKLITSPLTIASIFIGLMVVSLIHSLGHYANVNEAFIENLYVLYFFIPFPLLSIFVGMKAKKIGIRGKGCVILGVIFTFVLGIYGSFALLFNASISHNKNHLLEYSNQTGIEIPYDGYFTYVDMSMGSRTEETTLYAVMTLTNETEIMEFESALSNNPIWQNGINYNYMDFYNLTKVSEYEYFALYDCQTNQFVTGDLSVGDHHLICVAYDSEEKVVMIIDYYLEVENNSNGSVV